MTKYFTIEFNDLSFEKQEAMIGLIQESLLESYQDEAENGKYGKNFGRKEYMGMSWREAICREYDVDSEIWADEEEAKKFDWKYAVENFAQSQAELFLRDQISTRAEVEI
jgi:hypothetical protein